MSFACSMIKNTSNLISVKWCLWKLCYAISFLRWSSHHDQQLTFDRLYDELAMEGNVGENWLYRMLCCTPPIREHGPWQHSGWISSVPWWKYRISSQRVCRCRLKQKLFCCNFISTTTWTYILAREDPEKPLNDCKEITIVCDGMKVTFRIRI